MQKPLPRVGADDVSEEPGVVAIDEAIRTGRLVVSHPDGEVGRRFDRVVGDHPLPNGRPNDRESVGDEEADQGVDTGTINDEGGAWCIHLRTTVGIGPSRK